MEIQKLSYEDFAGKRYCSEVRSDKYLAIEPVQTETNMDFLLNGLLAKNFR